MRVLFGPNWAKQSFLFDIRMLSLCREVTRFPMSFGENASFVSLYIKRQSAMRNLGIQALHVVPVCQLS